MLNTEENAKKPLGFELSGSQKVTGSSPVSSTVLKPKPNKSLGYLPTVGSAAFSEMPNG